MDLLRNFPFFVWGKIKTPILDLLNLKTHMKNYPKIGIRPVIDGRQGGVRESLEEKTMNMAQAAAKLISENVLLRHLTLL